MDVVTLRWMERAVWMTEMLRWMEREMWMAVVMLREMEQVIWMAVETLRCVLVGGCRSAEVWIALLMYTKHMIRTIAEIMMKLRYVACLAVHSDCNPGSYN